jgi:branched-chain amino acid transport system substrate-binding protein
MKQRTPLTGAVSVLCIGALAFTVGCAKKEKSGTSASDGCKTSVRTSTKTPTAAASTKKPPVLHPVEADGVLTVGGLLPQTGSLAFLDPPEEAGVGLAVKDINEAGGVLGKPVKYIPGDSGDTKTDTANQTVDRLLQDNVDAIVGAASSSVTFTVIDKITGSGVIQFSPANTSKKLSTYNDKNLYFRTAPSDILQGQVLGDLVIGDGAQTAGLLVLQDPYGEGLLEDFCKSYTAGGGKVVKSVIYDPTQTVFESEVGQIKDSNPDAIVVIGFDESAKVIAEMIKQGVGPKDKKVYGVDGNMGNALADQIKSKGALTGMKGTTPLTDLSGDFKARIKAIGGKKLVDYNYAGESYDATVITALATLEAKSDGGTAIAAHINEVTKGGTKCDTFKKCADLIKAGTDIDYDGITGPLEFSDNGEPTVASYGILQFGADDKLQTLKFVNAGK